MIGSPLGSVIASPLGSVSTPPTLGGAPIPFPTITGLIGHWDFSAVSTLFQDAAGTTPVAADGDPIGLVQDQSSAAEDATQTVTAAKPTYKTGIINGRAVGRFTTDDYLALAITALPENTFTLFLVVSNATPAGTVLSFSGEKNAGISGRVYTGQNGTDIYANAGADGTTTGDIETSSVAVGTPYIHCVKGGSGTFSSYIDGSAAESGSFTNGTGWTNVNIGALSAASNFYEGDIGEIILYDSALSDADRGSVNSYLADRWGVTL